MSWQIDVDSQNSPIFFYRMVYRQNHMYGTLHVQTCITLIHNTIKHYCDMHTDVHLP